MSFLLHHIRTLLFALALHIAWCLPTHAQWLLPEPAPSFAQALRLFQKEEYERAQHYFEAYVQTHKDSLHAIEAQYYAALCATKLGRPDGEERFHQFIKNYPQHHKAQLAYYQLGNFYFTNQDFAKSIEYYLQVDKNTLDEATQYALQYCLAYAYLNKKDFDQALTYFNDIKAHKNAYCYAANYYVGYIAFRHEDYKTALENLMEASKDKAYQAIVPYLVLQVYYKQKRFQELLNYVHELSSTDTVLKNQDEIALLTAEAYFFTDQYAEAALHYEEYLALKDLVATSEVLYRTAYALYKAEEPYKALKYFKELALQEDAIGQLASYYTGLLYLKANKKPLALNAFAKAQQANFFADIQEEAAFHYGKVCYELRQFTSTIETLQKFKQDYATSKHLLEADDLLSEAYLRTNDYGLAIVHIEELATRPKGILKVYQKVTFYKGSQCFNDKAYDQAIQLFQKSLNHPFDKTIALQGQLWLGESLSATQCYEQAIAAYQYVLSSTAPTEASYQQALYGLAYAYFNTANYAQALPHFVQYASYKSNPRHALWCQDALLRSADCYYATKDYQSALQCYDQALQYHPAHVLYQKGLIYSILGDKTAARASLQAIFDGYANTVYYEKALFEDATIHFTQHNYTLAIQGFTRFIQQKPHSVLMPDTLLSRAIAYANLEQYAQAAQDYALLLKEYPTHPNAQSALLALPKLLALEGKSHEFEQYLANYKASNPNCEALEKLAFDTAQGMFYEQRYEAAVEQLKQFVVNYPTSRFAPEAHFLIAEAYYRQSHQEQAWRQYQAALQNTQTPFYSKILWRLGSLAYQQQDFAQALNYYQQLKDCAKNKKENYYALEGIMKASHALRHYEAVQQYARLIIKQGDLAVNATHEAILFLGKAAMEQGKRQEAQDYFTQVVQSNQGNHAAEAQYLLAQLLYEAEEYQQSLEALFELNKQFPTYKPWIDKGFLLIADNYIALKEDFHAKATLQSIIENANEEAVVANAQQKLASLTQKDTNLVEPSNTEEDELETLEE